VCNWSWTRFTTQRCTVFTITRPTNNLHLSNSAQNYMLLHVSDTCTIIPSTRMWANAQSDGRPAEYRWRLLFNAAKFGWRPLLQCRTVMLPRRETRWNLQACSKLPDRSQPLVGQSSPYCENMWRRYYCLISFFRLSIRALFAKIWPDKVVRWCQDG